MAREIDIDSAVRYERDKGKKLVIGDAHKSSHVQMLYDRDAVLWRHLRIEGLYTLYMCRNRLGFIKDDEELRLFAEMLGLEDDRLE